MRNKITICLLYNGEIPEYPEAVKPLNDFKRRIADLPDVCLLQSSAKAELLVAILDHASPDILEAVLQRVSDGSHIKIFLNENLPSPPEDFLRELEEYERSLPDSKVVRYVTLGDVSYEIREWVKKCSNAVRF